MENLTEIATTLKRSAPMNDTYTTADTLCDWALALQVEHQDRAEAQRLYEQALTIFPQHYRAAFLLADLHALAEQLEPAATYAKLAHRIVPSASSRQKVIEAVVKLAFHHAQGDAVADLLTDFGYLLSVGAHEEATALFTFIKEQYSSDPAVATAMAEVLTKQDRPDWISEWNAQDQACPMAIIQPPQQSAVSSETRQVAATTPSSTP